MADILIGVDGGMDEDGCWMAEKVLDGKLVRRRCGERDWAVDREIGDYEEEGNGGSGVSAIYLSSALQTSNAKSRGLKWRIITAHGKRSP